MELLLPGLMFFNPHSEKERKEDRDTRRAEKTRQEKRLFCSTCRHLITHQDERIPMQGRHEHRFTNPLGISYHIGCFREAAGCTTTGEPTREHTWFNGFAWQIALCGHCHAHLGWRFQSEQDYFHGLIIHRLISAGPEKT